MEPYIQSSASRCGLTDVRALSHFQPIVSLPHDRVIGHETLLRGWHSRDGLISFPELAARSQSADEFNRFLDDSVAMHIAGRPVADVRLWLFDSTRRWKTCSAC